MSILACILIFLGFYLMYKSSDKMHLKKSVKKKSLFQNIKWILNSCGLYLILMGYVVFVNEMSWGAGIFTATISLMTCGGLIILLAPLNLFNKN